MHLIALGLLTVRAVAQYTVPSTPPSNASQQLVAAPIGVSIEFFAWPGYTQLSATEQCLKNLADVGGSYPQLRIGGTTQDRATYNASSPDPVTYSVPNPQAAPASLTFGPSFFALINKYYKGHSAVGLNRQLNNLENTVAAAEKAFDTVKHLDAVELGNEPNSMISQ